MIRHRCTFSISGGLICIRIDGIGTPIVSEIAAEACIPDAGYILSGSSSIFNELHLYT